jgi:hypothetical protein
MQSLYHEPGRLMQLNRQRSKFNVADSDFRLAMRLDGFAARQL